MSHHPVRDTLRNISAKVWSDIREIKSQGRNPREESITDLNVLRTLFGIPPNLIKTVEFHKNEEGLNGADWEWIFLSKHLDQSFTVRVQAKVLNPHDQIYHELHYKKKNGRYQSDLLIEKAKESNALPVYCLYNYFDNIEKDDLWTCHCNYSAFDYYGCTLIDAAKVKALRAGNKNSLNDLKSNFLPMHCAITCNMDSSLSLPERVHQYWNVVMGNELPPYKKKRVVTEDGKSDSANTESDRLDAKPDAIDFFMIYGSENDIPSDTVDPLMNVKSDIPPVSSEIPEHVRHILTGKSELVDAKSMNLKATTIFFDE